MKIQIIEDSENEYNELCRKYNISIKEVINSTINKLLHDQEESNKKWLEEIEKYKKTEQYKNYLNIEINKPKVKIAIPKKDYLKHQAAKSDKIREKELNELDYKII
jgi:rRNA maturation endonuclease Nob1